MNYGDFEYRIGCDHRTIDVSEHGEFFMVKFWNGYDYEAFTLKSHSDIFGAFVPGRRYIMTFQEAPPFEQNTRQREAMEAEIEDRAAQARGE